MNAEVLQIISVTAFSFSGVFLVTAAILFFRLHIRSVIDDLSGRRAERQIRELREQNRQAGENGRSRYQPLAGKRTEALKGAGTGGGSSPGEAAAEGEERTTLLQEEGRTDILEEGTVLLGEDATTLLGAASPTLAGGYRLILDEIIIHTKERI